MTGSLDNRKLKKAGTEYLDTWDWQWYVTLTVPEHAHFPEEALYRLLKQWTRKLCTSEGIRVGCVYVIAYKNYSHHIHLLMVGRGRKHGKVKTLRDVNPVKWETLWPFRADIQIPDRNIAVSGYLNKQYDKEGNKASYNFYDKQLIKELKKSNDN